MKVTLEQLRTAGPCKEGYNRGIRLLQGEPFTKEDRQRTTYLECDHALPIPLEEIAERLGLQEALWATRCLEGHDRDLRLYAVWAVREIQHLLKDPRSWKVLDVAEAFANGEATAEELEEARADAYAAYRAYAAAYDAYYAAIAKQKAMFIKMCRGEAPWQVNH